MEQFEDSDYLGFAGDKVIEKLINGEKILFSDKIIKINRYNMYQERIIVITDKAIYNIKKRCKDLYITTNSSQKKNSA